MLEENKVTPVKEKSLELGSLATNFLLIVLASLMGWAGLNIEHIKEDMSVMKTSAALNANEIIHIKNALEHHTVDCDKLRNKVDALTKDVNEIKRALK